MVICNRCGSPDRTTNVAVGCGTEGCYGLNGRNHQHADLCDECQRHIFNTVKAEMAFKPDGIVKVVEKVVYAPATRIWPLWVFLILMSAANVGFWFWVGR